MLPRWRRLGRRRVSEVWTSCLSSGKLGLCCRDARTVSGVERGLWGGGRRRTSFERRTGSHSAAPSGSRPITHRVSPQLATCSIVP